MIRLLPSLGVFTHEALFLQNGNGFVGVTLIVDRPVWLISDPVKRNHDMRLRCRDGARVGVRNRSPSQ